MSEEIWKDIPNFSLYEISNKGKLRNKKTNYMSRQKPDKCGFIITHIKRDDGKNVSIAIHSIVASVFLSNPKKCDCVIHINKNNSDNCVENLKWVTKKEIMSNKTNKPRNGRLKIDQLDKNTEEVIKSWGSMREAGEFFRY